MRLRSVPVDLEKKMPRKAAVLSGAIAAARGTSHAYVVFASAASAAKALAHNMREVRSPDQPPCTSRLWEQLPQPHNSLPEPPCGTVYTSSGLQQTRARGGMMHTWTNSMHSFPVPILPAGPSTCLWQVEGLHLRVDRAAGSRSGSGATPVEYARPRSVFVGNLHFDTQVAGHQQQNTVSSDGCMCPDVVA